MVGRARYIPERDRMKLIFEIVTKFIFREDHVGDGDNLITVLVYSVF